MKFLLILSAVAFVLGTVSGECNQTAKAECITYNKKIITDRKVPEPLFCHVANEARVCVVRDAGCSEEDANLAARTVDSDMKLNCKSDENWEKDGICLAKEHKCAKDYNATIAEETDKSKICSAIGVYETCTMESGNCNRLVVSREIGIFMKRAQLDKCENIEFSACEDFPQQETCLNAFAAAKTQFDLASDETMICMLASATERCIRTKGKCTRQTIVQNIKRLLDTVECSEYVDLCDHVREEGCDLQYSDLDSCGKLNDYKLCLTTNASCPGPRLHPIMRKVMKDKNIDCEDTSACEYVKESNCDADATVTKTKAEEKCVLFNQYKKCLDRANCNEKYMSNRIEKMNVQLGHPCGASSILASIGLTLLLAAFAGPWK